MSSTVNNSMDVDSGAGGGAAGGGGGGGGGLAGNAASTIEAETSITIHPLAIVNMSDQYTRVTCGGSPLRADAPVVGLLFGKCSTSTISATTDKKNTGNQQQEQQRQIFTLQIVDADDIPTDASEAASLQVSLHQAVFPQNHVVGWYRVSNDQQQQQSSPGAAARQQQQQRQQQPSQPTANDVRLTQTLQRHYNEGGSIDQPFVFALLQVPSSSSSSSTEAATANDRDKKQPAIIKDRDDDVVEDGGDNDDDGDDDDLPFTMYKLVGEEESQMVLQALEDWTLATSDAERIAVERVLREKPSKSSTTTGIPATTTTSPAAVTTAKSKTGKGKMNEQQRQQQKQQQEDMEAAQANDDSTFVHAANDLEHSLSVLETRLGTIQQFLERVEHLPPEKYPHALVQQINSVLLHVHLCGGCSANNCYTDAGMDVVNTGGNPSTGNEMAVDSGNETRSTEDMTATTTSLLPPDITQLSPGVQQLAFLAKTLDAVQVYAEKFKLVYEHQQAPGGPGGGGIGGGSGIDHPPPHHRHQRGGAPRGAGGGGRY